MDDDGGGAEKGDLNITELFRPEYLLSNKQKKIYIFSLIIYGDFLEFLLLFVYVRVFKGIAKLIFDFILYVFCVYVWVQNSEWNIFKKIREAII